MSFLSLHYFSIYRVLCYEIHKEEYIIWRKKTHSPQYIASSRQGLFFEVYLCFEHEQKHIRQFFFLFLFKEMSPIYYNKRQILGKKMIHIWWMYFWRFFYDKINSFTFTSKTDFYHHFVKKLICKKQPKLK